MNKQVRVMAYIRKTPCGWTWELYQRPDKGVFASNQYYKRVHMAESAARKFTDTHSFIIDEWYGSPEYTCI